MVYFSNDSSTYQTRDIYSTVYRLNDGSNIQTVNRKNIFEYLIVYSLTLIFFMTNDEDVEDKIVSFAKILLDKQQN